MKSSNVVCDAVTVTELDVGVYPIDRARTVRVPTGTALKL